MSIPVSAIAAPVLCVLCGLFSSEEPVGPKLSFVQIGHPVTTVPGEPVTEVILGAGPFTIELEPRLFSDDGRGLELTVGREDALMPLVQSCQVMIDGPFFERLNRYSVSGDELTELYMDEPTAPGDRLGWVGLDQDMLADADKPTLTIESILDTLANGRAEVMVAGQEILLIAYAPSQSARTCDAPDGAGWTEPLVDARHMSFWRLRFE